MERTWCVLDDTSCSLGYELSGRVSEPWSLMRATRGHAGPRFMLISLCGCHFLPRSHLSHRDFCPSLCHQEALFVTITTALPLTWHLPMGTVALVPACGPGVAQGFSVLVGKPWVTLAKRPL